MMILRYVFLPVLRGRIDEEETVNGCIVIAALV